jgi:hypothetical protein
MTRPEGMSALTELLAAVLIGHKKRLVAAQATVVFPSPAVPSTLLISAMASWSTLTPPYPAQKFEGGDTRATAAVRAELISAMNAKLM